MKISRILPFVVGSAAAGILASISPAHALTWTVNNAIFADGATASGTFDYNAALNQYSNISITLSNATTYPLAAGFYTSANNIVTADATFLDVFRVSSNSYFRLTFVQPLTDLGGTVNIVNTTFLSGSGTGQTYYGESFFLGSIVGAGTNATVTAASVPFDIPGGATIPTVGSLFALALMRKVRKSLSSKTRIANPVETVVS